jgi:hypothetical protein
MLKNLALALGLLAGLSACAAPIRLSRIRLPWVWIRRTAYSGYGYAPAPTYYGPDYLHPSQHGTVQP